MTKVDEDEKNDKPLFIVRSIAFIFDIFLVLLLSSFISAPFVNADKLSSLAQSSRELVEKYQNNEITDREYQVEISNLQYQMSVNMELVTLIRIFIGLVYYVILPLYNNGQTFGKKIMKLKIISTHGDLNSNQLIFRSFIANFILLNLLSLVFLMFASRDVYAMCVELFTFVQYIITAISIIMVIVDQYGLSIHDRVVRTKVVKVN